MRRKGYRLWPRDETTRVTHKKGAEPEPEASPALELFAPDPPWWLVRPGDGARDPEAEYRDSGGGEAGRPGRTRLAEMVASRRSIMEHPPIARINGQEFSLEDVAIVLDQAVEDLEAGRVAPDGTVERNGQTLNVHGALRDAAALLRAVEAAVSPHVTPPDPPKGVALQ